MPAKARASLEIAIGHIQQVMDGLSQSLQSDSPPILLYAPDGAGKMARHIYAFRRKRDLALKEVADLFHDPAWDLLLDLFVASENGSNISVSSACIASAVPPTTGLRAITVLKERGVLEFRPDPFDKRRTFVDLSESMRERMRALLME